MGTYSVITKVMIGDISEDAYTVSGSIAKEVTTYLNTIDTGKTLRLFTTSVRGQQLIVTVVHDA